MTFGHPMLEHWTLDPSITYLNHGTVGVTPRRVMAAQQALREEVERQPSRFILRELNGHGPAPWRAETRLREAVRPIAAFIGARPEDVVFVPNVTTGVNAVLQSVPLSCGDEVVITDLAYGAITLTAKYVTERAGAHLRIVRTPFPLTSPGAVVQAIGDAITAQTKLVVVDHVSANSALVLPVADIVTLSHDRGVPVLVDGAHAPGSIALDVGEIGADWYSANLHKWAHAPRACGFLWARSDRQQGLHPAVISWGSGHGFLTEFEWTPTADPTNYLAAPEGVALLRAWGWDEVRGYMHGLAWDGAKLLTERWKTTLDAPREMIGAMVTVPLPASIGSTREQATALRTALLVEDRIEAPIHEWHGRLWVRVSAQVYNDLSDVERLADAVLRRID